MRVGGFGVCPASKPSANLHTSKTTFHAFHMQINSASSKTMNSLAYCLWPFYVVKGIKRMFTRVDVDVKRFLPFAQFLCMYVLYFLKRKLCVGFSALHSENQPL